MEPYELICRCGEAGVEPEPCPFAVEINDDDEPCICCDDCRDQCAEDV